MINKIHIMNCLIISRGAKIGNYGTEEIRGKKKTFHFSHCWRLLQLRFSHVGSEPFAPIRCESVAANDREVGRTVNKSKTKVKTKQTKLRHMTNCQFSSEGSIPVLAHNFSHQVSLAQSLESVQCFGDL